MHAPKPSAVRSGRVQKSGATIAIAERKRAQKRAAYRATAAEGLAPAPCGGEAVTRGPVARVVRSPDQGPFRETAPRTGARRDAIPTRAPNSLLCDVDDEGLSADIVDFIKSGADLVCLIAGVTKQASDRKVNGRVNPATAYRALCAERVAARVEGRKFVWKNVFKAMPNAALPGNPTACSNKVKNYCEDFLFAYLEAHPGDDQAAPGTVSAEQPTTNVPSQKVPSVIRLKIKLTSPRDDCGSPPTPFVERGGLADDSTTLLFGRAQECFVQAQKLAAASSRMADKDAAGADEAWEHDGGDGDVLMKTDNEGALGHQHDDEVVYVKTTRYGVQ